MEEKREDAAELLLLLLLLLLLYGPRDAKRARTTWHVISSNLHLKFETKQIQEALRYVHSRSDFYGFNCYFRTFITSIMFFWEWSGQKCLKLKMDKICRPGPFRMTRPTWKICALWLVLSRFLWKRSKPCILFWSKASKFKICNQDSEKMWISPFFTAKLPEKAKKIEILPRFRRWVKKTIIQSERVLLYWRSGNSWCRNWLGCLKAV